MWLFSEVRRMLAFAPAMAVFLTLVAGVAFGLPMPAVADAAVAAVSAAAYPVAPAASVSASIHAAAAAEFLLFITNTTTLVPPPRVPGMTADAGSDYLAIDSATPRTSPWKWVSDLLEPDSWLACHPCAYADMCPPSTCAPSPATNSSAPATEISATYPAEASSPSAAAPLDHHHQQQQRETLILTTGSVRTLFTPYSTHSIRASGLFAMTAAIPHGACISTDFSLTPMAVAAAIAPALYKPVPRVPSRVYFDHSAVDDKPADVSALPAPLAQPAAAPDQYTDRDLAKLAMMRVRPTPAPGSSDNGDSLVVATTVPSTAAPTLEQPTVLPLVNFIAAPIAELIDSSLVAMTAYAPAPPSISTMIVALITLVVACVAKRTGYNPLPPIPRSVAHRIYLARMTTRTFLGLVKQCFGKYFRTAIRCIATGLPSIIEVLPASLFTAIMDFCPLIQIACEGDRFMTKLFNLVYLAAAMRVTVKYVTRCDIDLDTIALDMGGDILSFLATTSRIVWDAVCFAYKVFCAIHPVFRKSPIIPPYVAKALPGIQRPTPFRHALVPPRTFKWRSAWEQAAAMKANPKKYPLVRVQPFDSRNHYFDALRRKSLPKLISKLLRSWRAKVPAETTRRFFRPQPADPQMVVQKPSPKLLQYGGVLIQVDVGASKPLLIGACRMLPRVATAEDRSFLLEKRPKQTEATRLLGNKIVGAGSLSSDHWDVFDGHLKRPRSKLWREVGAEDLTPKPSKK
ncbi:hypothetical protein H9P43_006973 [Blastocladiella emersonii ATCC 22665]|nr:hypothetical protein H9P43_006973 [Blastocladiella emersonii ATCC 22665]